MVNETGVSIKHLRFHRAVQVRISNGEAMLKGFAARCCASPRLQYNQIECNVIIGGEGGASRCHRTCWPDLSPSSYVHQSTTALAFKYDRGLLVHLEFTQNCTLI